VTNTGLAVPRFRKHFFLLPFSVSFVGGTPTPHSALRRAEDFFCCSLCTGRGPEAGSLCFPFLGHISLEDEGVVSRINK